LFLDPTQVQGLGGRYHLDAQIQALAAFHEEMREMRGLDVGTVIRVPVAVCISKLDLLTRYSPLSGGARKWLRSVRTSLARPVTLAEIRHRSELCEQVLPLLFPGWKLVRALEDNFGASFMFFPMTPVGLEEDELGVEDLAQRTFAPVGILEPILWLLYMHGFCVFQ
jgi:hypothetical protein